MNPECAYSFADLFKAAFGRQPEEKQLLDLYALPQEQRNTAVSEWAKKAGWQAEERIGTDGKSYAAFAPRS